MASKNRFKTSGPTVNFNDPAVLTVVPADLQEELPVPVVIPEKKAEPTPQPEKVEKPKEEKPAEEKKDTAQKENILEGMVEPKSTGKTYALYLETDVVAALDKLAKQNKVSRSKALNTLLRNMLIK